MLNVKKIALLVTLFIFWSGLASAEKLGSVNTEWKLMGSHQLVVEVFDDPKVDGVACYVSKPQRGGVAGAVGIAEEASDVSIACRQVGDIHFKAALSHKEIVFNERRSFIFKTLHVIRLVDSARNTLVYLSYTDKILSGSPKNSVTAVHVNKTLIIPVRK